MADRKNFDTDVVERVWRRHLDWSAAALEATEATRRARLSALVLAVAAAAAGTGASLLDGMPARVLAFVAAAAVALGAIAGRARDRDAVRVATSLRAVAEALKAQVFTYLAGASPYDGADREDVLMATANRLTPVDRELRQRVSAAAARPEPLPPVSDPDSYTRHRAQEQVDDYYRPRARRMGRNARWCRRVEWWLGVAAALGSVAAGTVEMTGATVWLGVVTTATTAVGAHAKASRYEYLQFAYGQTADELEALLAGRRSGRIPDAAFVAACERLLAAENQAWLALWQSSDGEGRTAG